MKSYSKEFRRDVLAACDAGDGTREVALQFDVSESWVRRVKQERRESGKIAPKTTRDRSHVWDAWSDWLVKTIDEKPDIYLREIRVALKSELGVDVSLKTVSNACRALKRTRKKDADRLGTGTRRRGIEAFAVARESGTDRSGPSGLHRRNVGED